MSLARRLWFALTRSGAETSPDAEDARLRGRTYAVPFDRVWNDALRLAGGGLKRWQVRNADDYEGIIRAHATAFLFRRDSDITIRITLDEDAQTRVDARAENPTGKADLGTGARHLARFFRALDRTLTGERRPAARTGTGGA